jgi:hypothetical protein
MAVKTLQQAEERLIELREKRKALDREMQDLKHLIADLSDSPLKNDNRERDRNIYLDWEAGRLTGKKMHWLELGGKYDLGPDQLRLIHKQQKEIIENEKD